MQNIITMELLAGVSDNGFSLDELVYELGRVIRNKGLPGIVAMILALVDELLLRRHLEGRSWLGQACCERPVYQSLGFHSRRIRTSLGEVSFRWRRYQCQACGRVRVPLREFLGLEPHQSRTNELEQIVVEVVSEQSYRRSSQHLDTIGGIPVPKSTAHRWLVQSDSDELARTEGKFASLLVDGTGYKRRPDASVGLDNKGQLRMAIGITPTGQVCPLGTWSGVGWEQIARNLGAGLEKETKLAGLLVSDGETGLAEALGRLTDDQQRCLWHLPHDLDDPMWRDGASKREYRSIQKKLAALVRIELPAEDGEAVGQEDRERIEQQMGQAQQGVVELVAQLKARGYRRAARYVDLARSRLFGYLRFWLRHGIVNPKVTSFLERLMREIGRRLKRIAFGWRPENAAKMARLLLRRVTDPQQWAQYWKTKLRLQGNVVFAFRGVHASPPTLGR